MKNDDARLVESVLAGNLDDYRKLVDAYQLSAEQWAFRQVRNISDAEEIAQEAFVEAYFRLDTLREADKFGGWLRRIVVNTAVSWLRRRKNTVRFDEITSISGDGELREHYNRYEAITPHDLLERQERQELLRMAIDALSPTYRNIITMFYFDDCSYKEIATRLTVSEAAVKSKLHRARTRLKEEVLRMSTGQTESRIEISRKFGEQVTQDIVSVREELVAIRQLLKRLDPGDSIAQAMNEYRKLPLGLGDEKMIRWGFMGCLGSADSPEHSAYSIHTMKQEDYFGTPEVSDGNVASFADAFTNPHTIRICKFLFFRQDNGNATRAEIKRECNLSDEELDVSLEAFLDWRFVAWKGEELLILGQGMNWVITLIGMTREGINQRDASDEQE